MNNGKSNQNRPVRRSADSTNRAERFDGAPRGTARRDSSASPTRRQKPDQAAFAQRGSQKTAAPFDGSPDASNPYARRVSQAEYARQRTSAKRKRIALIAAAVAVVLVLTGGGVAFAYYQNISSNLHQGVDDDLLRALQVADNGKPYEGGPFYMLLMGTDGSSDRAASEEYAGDQFRSDSMMLTRIDPQNKKVTLVSLHRDTDVDMGTYGNNKLNAAHALGGPALTVETVSKMAGVPITHYAEINFDGFKEIVDALGGVDVDVPMEINDEDAGGYVAKGQQTLNGDQALILCRARNAYNDFGDGDRFRAANQRLVLSAIAKKVLESDAATMVNTVAALSKHVTTDFEISGILSVAQSMRGLNPEQDVYTAMEPTTASYVNGGWYEYLDVPAWEAMMARVDQGLPPTEGDVVDEASGTVLATTGNGGTQNQGQSKNASSSSTSKAKSNKVMVQNGNGTPGASSVAAEQVEALGYTTSTGNADNFDYQNTVVLYREDSRADEARKIANALGMSNVQREDGRHSFEGDFLVIVGADW